ncbi:MAG: aminodeoxychorismate lyase [Eubacteriales bacterium]
MNKQSPISFILVTIGKIAVVVGLVYLVYRISITSYDFGYRILNEPPMSSSDITVEVVITEAQSVMEIGEMLEEKRLIQDARIFYFQEWFSKYHDDILPGTYELSPSMTGDEMVEIMAAGSDA